MWPNRAPLRRAARYDGVFPVSHERPLEADDIRAMREVVAEHRAPDAGAFDVVITNHERPGRDRLGELAEAGTTWWLQGFGEAPRLADVAAAAAAGPPQ